MDVQSVLIVAGLTFATRAAWENLVIPRFDAVTPIVPGTNITRPNVFPLLFALAIVAASSL